MSDLLIDAITNNDVKYIQTLRDALATDESIKSNRIFNDHFASGVTPLNLAIRLNHLDVARLLIDCGSDINYADSFRVDGCEKRPIHYACAAGCLSLVKELVEVRGVDPDECDCSMAPPIHYAALHGNAGLGREYLNVSQ